MDKLDSLQHDSRADRSLPGGARPAPRRGLDERLVEAQGRRCWPPSPLSSRSATTRPPTSREDGDESLAGRSGKLNRLEELIADVFAAGERILIFTHFAQWGEKLAAYLTERMGHARSVAITAG